MSVKIDKIDDKTYIFNEEGVRFFLLLGDEKALLIDSGMMTKNAKELAEEITDLPIELLNTHADPDHIASNDEFDSFYMHPAESVNFYKNQNRKGEIIPIWENTILDLGDRPLRIIELPGHTPGSVAILDENNDRIFSGDPVQDGRIFMFGPQREMNAYLLSLKKLRNLDSEFEDIYPSHGSYPVKSELIDNLIIAAENIINHDFEAQEFEMFGNPILDYDAKVAHFLLDKE